MKIERLDKPRRHRELTRHEIDLWIHATRDVVKMRGEVAPIEPQTIKKEDSVPKRSTHDREVPGASHPIAHHPLPRPRIPSLPPLAPVEPKLKRRLARGQRSVDAALDLHGMRQEEAHGAILSFLMRQQASGARVVLVVTGKGAASTTDRWDERPSGVLRRAVPHWLREPSLRKVVLGFEEAAPTLGGYGALLIRIRQAVPHPRQHE